MKVLLKKQFDWIRRFLHRLVCQRRCSLTRALVVIVCISLTSFVVLSYYQPGITMRTGKTSKPPVPSTSCNYFNFKNSQERGPHNHETKENLRIGKRVLVFVDSPYSKHAKEIVGSLEASRFPYKVVMGDKQLPTLTHMDKGRFGAIIFEKIQLYLGLDYWNRQLLEKYCRDYDVGMIYFVKPQDDYEKSYEKVPGFPMALHYNVGLKDYRLNPDSSVWRVTRPGEIIRRTFPTQDWTVFYLNHSTYEPLSFAKIAPSFYEDTEDPDLPENTTVYPAVLDRGLHDGICRVFFGNLFQFWLHKPMLLDALSYLSHGKLSVPLERHMQIDIDDIFVGRVGTRMKAHDVEVIIP